MTWKITGAPGTGDDLLYSQAGTPTLDLRFASSKSLNDNVSGQNLIDFTRGGNGVGTYVGSDGLIKRSVVNLLLRSEEFTSTSWTLFGSGSRSANVATAPNGASTADSVTLPVGSGIYQQVTGSVNTAYTFSIWLRSDTTQTIRVLINTNLSDPTAVTVNVTTTWQRFSVTKTTSVGGTLLSAQLDTGGGGSFYLWGAQLEQSSTVGEYVKTTSSISGAPRFDHDPETGESLGLLIEEQRTNLLKSSEDISTADWTRERGTSSSSTTAKPDGSTSSTPVVWSEDGSLSTTHRIIPSIITGTVASYTFSVFLKARERTKARVTVWDGATEKGVDVDLIAGTRLNVNNPSSSSITPFANGWYRVSVTATFSAATCFGIVYIANNAGVVTYTGDGTSGLYLWGAQLEEGAFPTSYIPTTSAQVTRNADLASITGSNFSSWYRQDEGTVFAEITGYPIATSQFPRIFEASDGTSNNTIRLQQYSTNSVRASIIDGGVTQMAQDGGVILKGSQGKTALAFANNDCALVVDGGTPSVDTSVTIATNMTQSTIGAAINGTSPANSTISRLTFFDRRLPNATLEAITG